MMDPALTEEEWEEKCRTAELLVKDIDGWTRSTVRRTAALALYGEYCLEVLDLDLLHATLTIARDVQDSARSLLKETTEAVEVFTELYEAAKVDPAYISTDPCLG